MAVTKKFLKSKPICKVTFAISAPEATKVTLVGDFNDWDVTTTSLKKLKNGTFKVVLDLDTDKSHEYKYVVDGEYLNDPEPEALVFNAFANAENSFIEL